MWRYILFGALAGMIALAIHAYGYGWLSYYLLGFEAPSYSWRFSESWFWVWLIGRVWLGAPLGAASAYAWRQWRVGATRPAILICRWVGIACMLLIGLQPQFQYSLHILPRKLLAPDFLIFFWTYWVSYLDFQWAFLLLTISFLLKREQRKTTRAT